MSHLTTYIFSVNGMHCNACVLLTESELEAYPGVVSARSSLKQQSVEITGDFGDRTKETIVTELNALLKPHGYSLSLDRQVQSVNWADFTIAFPVALLFVVFFLLLQKMGIVHWVDTETVSYSTIFLVGVVASLSTCMAVVGGLVLSMSATFAKEGDRVKPQLLFHAGRLGAFFLLGGAIGAIGANFSLSATATFVLSFLIGLVMLILGVNLLDVFPWARRFQFAIPKFLSTRAYAVAKFNHTLTPFLVGVATFFLPCGFTQSMQLYTLSTGTFFEGAFTMLFYALGTLPALALMSFSSLSIQGSRQAGVFFKVAGLIVIFFALFNIINSLVVIGLIPPIFHF